MGERNNTISRIVIVCPVILAFVSLAVAGTTLAQDTPPVADSLPAPPDSLTADSLPADTSAPAYQPDDSVVIDPILYRPGDDTLLVRYYGTADSTTPKRSPTLTMFKSVALPGWGQISNGKYLKAGIVILAESYFIYRAIDYGQKAADWREKWQNAPEELKFSYFNSYADYRDKRNTNLWYTAVVVFLSMFDAYVDAHLQTFPASETAEISLALPENDRVGLEISYRF